MDFHEIWQENKRWILSCVAGVLLFFVGKSVIAGVYDTSAVDKKWRAANSTIRAEKYRRQQLNLATKDGEALEKTYQEIETALAMKVPERFQLAGKGHPDIYWSEQKRKVIDDLLNQAAETNVDLEETAFHWPNPVEREQVRRALVGLCVLNESVQRLIAAHRQVVEKYPDALGLRRIGSLRIQDAKSKPYRRAGKFNAEDQIDDYPVYFEVYADYRTIHSFLESCRRPGLPLALFNPSIAQGRSSGDSLLFKATAVGYVVKPLVTGEEGN